MPGYTRRQIRRDILKEMILRECACQDQEELRSAHGVKFHNNGPEEESGMIRSNLHTLSQQAQEMHDMIGMNDDLDEWVQEKIAVASSMIDSVYDYIGYEYKALRGEVGSHDSYNPDVSADMHTDDDTINDDRIASFETGYDWAMEDMDDDFDDEGEFDEYTLQEVAPPGGEDVVKALKGKKGIDNPYAVAWGMHNKGYDLDEELLDELIDDEDMIAPWEPLHQSTGIMFFEDEMNESKRRKKT